MLSKNEIKFPKKQFAFEGEKLGFRKKTRNRKGLRKQAGWQKTSGIYWARYRYVKNYTLFYLFEFFSCKRSETVPQSM